MERLVRPALIAIVVFLAIVALLFVLQVPWAISVPPLEGRTTMSNIFIASILLAAAASTGWCLLVRSDRALTGIGLDVFLIFSAVAIVLFAAAVNGGGLYTAVASLGSVIVAGAGLWLMRWAQRHPWTDPRPTPRLVLGSFAFFVVALVIVSTLLILRVPNILPWRITPELSTLYGFMFLGASAYFAYGLVERRWENAGGQLAGFLAYDIVLIVPFARQLSGSGTSDYDVGGEALPLNLLVYTLVVVYSGALAISYLFIDKRTRLRGFKRP